MASQTGTLKFRQSDGAYTELYPKTTIAQVDGLQTQLDSINTSLQNKVEKNTSAYLRDVYTRITSINNDLGNFGVNQSQKFIGMSYNIYNDSNAFQSYRGLVLYANPNVSINDSVKIITKDSSTSNYNYFTLATQQWVNDIIIGAINTSY